MEILDCYFAQFLISAFHELRGDGANDRLAKGRIHIDRRLSRPNGADDLSDISERYLRTPAPKLISSFRACNTAEDFPANEGL